MAAPSTVLTVVKTMSYRGVAGEEWSNTYALDGSTPADDAAWRTLFDALVLQEKTLYTSDCHVVRGYGYSRIPVTGDHAVWTVDLSVSPNTPVAGTFSASLANEFAGDQACWVRWGLDRFNTKGKRIYLRKYYHMGMVQSGTPDSLASGLVTALGAFGTKMIDGSFSGSRHLVDKLGNVPIGTGHSTFVTTRTLKRRGKRP